MNFFFPMTFTQQQHESTKHLTEKYSIRILFIQNYNLQRVCTRMSCIEILIPHYPNQLVIDKTPIADK